MTQNNGWFYGGNDGVTDATRPLQNVNGQASYQPANQQQGQNGVHGLHEGGDLRLRPWTMRLRRLHHRDR